MEISERVMATVLALIVSISVYAHLADGLARQIEHVGTQIDRASQMSDTSGAQ